MLQRVESAAGGLSPRLRGNLATLVDRTSMMGSIPAPAGEPPRAPCPVLQGAVYPRACGGTMTALGPSLSGTGLSPRLRGNPIGRHHIIDLFRSIPAPAGEPPRSRPEVCQSTVYPRACGGTDLHCPRCVADSGLSPRLRGNHTSPSAHRHRSGLSPRLRGNLWASTMPSALLPGLSPRLRGNQHHVGPGLGGVGSIPAPAGEPSARHWANSKTRVYPRACGGT